MAEKTAVTGIITFHCADNYGAMLQAYGLKRFLCCNGMAAEIVCYEPPYMTGRHWLIPYMPRPKSFAWCLRNMQRGLRANLSMLPQFMRRRANMRRFRQRYLFEDGQRKIFTLHGLGHARYRNYVVGSDQIWNPAITCGLRKAYFGAFRNRHKKRVVAYAASMGGDSMDPCYEGEFSRLVSSIDAVSVREASAAPYVGRFFPGTVMPLPDPVFLLDKEDWQKIERQPDRKGYILVYSTEHNPDMAGYVKELSAWNQLEVVEIWQGLWGTGHAPCTDYTAGPSEFLGYIHHARYVVTNSFHAAAFSVIFQKQFIVFAHSSLNARLQDMLDACGLADRIYRGGSIYRIDDAVDWYCVHAKIDASIRKARRFLMENLSE